MKYSIAKQYCVRAGLKSREDYRNLRARDVNAYNMLPADGSVKNYWEKEWTNWDDFLRNPALIPPGAEDLGNNYYKLNGSIYNHNAKGFIELAKRQHPDGKWISDIRNAEGKVVSIYLEAAPAEFYAKYQECWDKYINSERYITAVKTMLQHGMEQPYIDNILRGAFDFGFNK